MSKLSIGFLIFCILFVIVGCHAVKDSLENYNSCINDDICKQKMMEYGNLSVNVVRSSGVSNNIFECIAYNIVSGLSGVLLGRKLRKKK